MEEDIKMDFWLNYSVLKFFISTIKTFTPSTFCAFCHLSNDTLLYKKESLSTILFYSEHSSATYSYSSLILSSFIVRS